VEITFSLPHLYSPGASPRENAEGLRVLLDALIAMDQWYLRHHAARPLYAASVRYARTDLWETIPALYAASYHGTDRPDSNFAARYGRFGDCKSLTAARVAELRENGFAAEPVFRFAQRPGGSNLFHILVRWHNGRREQWEDPSAKLGMGQDELKWFK
jgi:hypothetical protein